MRQCINRDNCVQMLLIPIVPRERPSATKHIDPDYNRHGAMSNDHTLLFHLYSLSLFTDIQDLSTQVVPLATTSQFT